MLLPRRFRRPQHDTLGQHLREGAPIVGGRAAIVELSAGTFEVVLIAKDKAVGFSFAPKVDKTTKYDGAAIELKL